MIRNLRWDFAFGARYRESLSASGSIERVNELEYQSIIVASSALPPNKLYLTQKVSYFLLKLTKQFQLRNLWKFAWNHTRNFHRILLRNAIIPKCEIIFLCFQIISSRLYWCRDILYFRGVSAGWGNLGNCSKLFLCGLTIKKKLDLGLVGRPSLKTWNVKVWLCVCVYICECAKDEGFEDIYRERIIEKESSYGRVKTYREQWVARECRYRVIRAYRSREYYSR